jgi:putative aldouronate transport system permease protein
MPLVLLIMSSITSERSLVAYGYSLFPKEFSLDAYRYLWTSRDKILRAYGMTIFVTTVGTLINVALTTLIAYPLSRKTLPGRNAIAFFIFFTMLFNGGMIPSYLMWTQYFHIKDTVFGLIVPTLLLNAFQVIIMRTYFSTNLPVEIIEAAKIDGAGEFNILAKIVLPLSTPIITTVALLSGLAYWNDWLNGLYYLIERTDLFTIQNLLNRIIANADFLNNNQNNQFLSMGFTVPSIGVRMAIAVIALIPILVVYPIFQRGFVKGIVVGGVKG